MFHIGPHTGVVSPCHVGADCSAGEHYPDKSSAVAAFEAHNSIQLHLSQPNFGKEFDDRLEAAVQGGFVKASEDYPLHFDAQVNFLCDPHVVGYVADKMCVSNKSFQQNRLARVLAWISVQIAREGGIRNIQAFREHVQPKIRTTRGRKLVEEFVAENNLADAEDLVQVSASLWSFRFSPFHERAKRLLCSSEYNVSGYTPKSEKNVFKTPSADACKKLQIDVADLPENVLAFDIETDTTNGFGLRPNLTQITEIVASTNEVSWVFSGDEEFILEQFAQVVNDMPPETSLAGWNNRCFDNVVLQTRAEFHETPNWSGLLVPSENESVFEAASWSGEATAMLWASHSNSDFVEFVDIDVFQEKIVFDRSIGEKYTRGLKPFVESLGCTPISVERHKLHELNESDRIAYVLSDGLATLRALGELRRMQNM